MFFSKFKNENEGFSGKTNLEKIWFSKFSVFREKILEKNGNTIETRVLHSSRSRHSINSFESFYCSMVKEKKKDFFFSIFLEWRVVEVRGASPAPCGARVITTNDCAISCTRATFDLFLIGTSQHLFSSILLAPSFFLLSLIPTIHSHALYEILRELGSRILGQEKKIKNKIITIKKKRKKRIQCVLRIFWKSSSLNRVDDLRAEF